jgi:hypothetical protein
MFLQPRNYLSRPTKTHGAGELTPAILYFSHNDVSASSSSSSTTTSTRINPILHTSNIPFRPSLRLCLAPILAVLIRLQKLLLLLLVRLEIYVAAVGERAPDEDDGVQPNPEAGCVGQGAGGSAGAGGGDFWFWIAGLGGERSVHLLLLDL